jgi:hypothetical protein
MSRGRMGLGECRDVISAGFYHLRGKPKRGGKTVRDRKPLRMEGKYPKCEKPLRMEGKYPKCEKHLRIRSL